MTTQWDVDELLGAQASFQPAAPVRSGISRETPSPPSQPVVAVALMERSAASSVTASVAVEP
jgi:hypothetical protein